MALTPSAAFPKSGESDAGTALASSFQSGSADALYRSITRRLFTLLTVLHWKG